MVFPQPLLSARILKNNPMNAGPAGSAFLCFGYGFLYNLVEKRLQNPYAFFIIRRYDTAMEVKRKP
jgi:hypothetical protein